MLSDVLACERHNRPPLEGEATRLRDDRSDMNESLGDQSQAAQHGHGMAETPHRTSGHIDDQARYITRD